MNDSWIRKSAVAGSFYPDNPQKLKLLIHEYLERQTIDFSYETIIAAVVPHAGYIYSGRIAADVYRIYKSLKLETVILLGVNHRYAGFKGLSMMHQGEYQTPLGSVKIDHQLAGQISNLYGGIPFVKEVHEKEHSIEVQIPFLQSVMNDFKIIPIIMSDYSKETCEKLAGVLNQTLNPKNQGLIASTDLSHFHTQKKAYQLDEVGIRSIESLDVDKFYRDYCDGKTEFCGFGPVLTAMFYSKKYLSVKSKILNYAHSGEVNGDLTQVVGYLSAVFYESNE